MVVKYMGTVPYTSASVFLTVKHPVHMESMSAWEWLYSMTLTVGSSNLPKISMSFTIMIIMYA